ncbi:MAG: hypothetical protein ACE5NA_08620 [Nitrospiraceae bacterium]
MTARELRQALCDVPDHATVLVQIREVSSAYGGRSLMHATYERPGSRFILHACRPGIDYVLDKLEWEGESPGTGAAEEW